MTGTKPPPADALAFADWVLEFLVGYKTWAIEENRLALAQRIDAFAEQRAAEAPTGDAKERGHKVLTAVLRNFDSYSTRYRLLDSELEIARALTAAEDKARRAAIAECADTCRALGHYSGHNVQPAIEQIADAILALAGKPAAGKGEP